MADERGEIEFTVRPHDGPSLVHWHGGRMERERELVAEVKRLKGIEGSWRHMSAYSLGRKRYLEGERENPYAADDSLKISFQNGMNEEAELARLKGRAAELEGVFGQAEPWPLVDVLERLIDLGEHAQTTHDCDRHGYEEDTEAMKSGYQLLKRLRACAVVQGAKATP